MACTTPIAITWHDGNTLNLNATNYTIQWHRGPEFKITHKTGQDGYVSDDDRGYRTIIASGIISSSELTTFNTAFLAAQTYDTTDPKIIICLDGTNTLTIYIATVKAQASPTGHGKFDFNVTFEERSHDGAQG